MCKCTPNKRTPFCGAPGCESPASSPVPSVNPGIQTVILPPCLTPRRLYVNRTCARNLEPPIMADDMATGQRWYASNVKWSDPQDQSHTEFKWSGNNMDAPALWIETDAELELTL